MLSQRYVPIQELGRGATSVVRLCRDTTTDRLVVLKHISNACYTKRHFDHELEINKQAACPQIVSLVTSFATEEGFCFVFEFGKTDLRSLIEERGPLTEPQARRVFRDMSRALSSLHSKGIIHQDVKLDNMIVMADNTVKLTDFGFAEKIDKNGTTTSRKGTFQYWSPEIISRKPHDAKADVWALGVCLFTALTGSFPFTGRREYDYSMRVMMGRIDLHLLDQVTPELRNLITAMLSKDPASRPSSVDLVDFPWDMM